MEFSGRYYLKRHSLQTEFYGEILEGKLVILLSFYKLGDNTIRFVMELLKKRLSEAVVFEDMIIEQSFDLGIAYMDFLTSIFQHSQVRASEYRPDYLTIVLVPEN